MFMKRLEINKMVELVGGGFHPDTDFHDYVNKDGRKSFNDDRCNTLNEVLDDLFEEFNKSGECIYGYSIDVLKKYYQHLNEMKS